MRDVLRICSMLAIAGIAIAANSARPARALQDSPAGQVQVIEVTAKRYEFDPATIHVKQGAKVQLKFTALDRDHGFKVSVYPDGSDGKGQPGLLFTSYQACLKLVKGTPTVVEFVAQTAGTYSFKCCNFCGMGHGGMKGQIVVDPADGG